jgi:hypothetical protein
MAVESRIDKESAPQGRPGSRLVPGQGKPVVREKAENEGFSARATSEGRRRKRGAEQEESAESLLIGTRATDVGGRENHGKLACLPEKMGTKKRRYASAIIGAHWPLFSRHSPLATRPTIVGVRRRCRAPSWVQHCSPGRRQHATKCYVFGFSAEVCRASCS